MDNKELEKYLDTFQRKIEDELMPKGNYLISPDLEKKWREIAPEYIADAVKEWNEYPEVALAWAGFIGLAIAHEWDKDWEKYSGKGYNHLLGKRGFDDMDEHILQNILGYKLDSIEASGITHTLRSSAERILKLIQSEGIEGQTATAFYIFSRCVNVMYCFGVSMELKKLGYNYHSI